MHLVPWIRIAGLVIGLGILSPSASANDRTVVTDWRGNPVRVETNGTCVRLRWLDNEDRCREQLTEVSYTLPSPAISEEQRTVYFPFNVAALTPDAKAKLDALAGVIKSRQDVKQARVAGYADRIGTPSYNESLSKKRAENVRSYLISKGIVTANVVETRWFGEGHPKTDCAGSLSRPALIQCLAADRRVEVVIDYKPEVTASR